MKNSLVEKIKEEIGERLNKNFNEIEIKQIFYENYNKKDVDEAYQEAFDYWVDAYYS